MVIKKFIPPVAKDIVSHWNLLLLAERLQIQQESPIKWPRNSTSYNHVFFDFWEVASATRKLMIKTRIKANHILVKAFIWCICIILWIWIFIRIFITAVLSSFFSFLPIVIFVRLQIGHLEFTISRLILYVSSPSTHFAPVQLKPRKHWGWNGFA